MMKAAMKVRSMPRPAIEKITVSFDGTWLTRGFSSLYCAGAVIEWESGLVLDYEVLSLYCQVSIRKYTLQFFISIHFLDMYSEQVYRRRKGTVV